jgi:hypothetical protein
LRFEAFCTDSHQLNPIGRELLRELQATGANTRRTPAFATVLVEAEGKVAPHYALR